MKSTTKKEIDKEKSPIQTVTGAVISEMTWVDPSARITELDSGSVAKSKPSFWLIPLSRKQPEAPESRIALKTQSLAASKTIPTVGQFETSENGTREELGVFDNVTIEFLGGFLVSDRFKEMSG